MAVSVRTIRSSDPVTHPKGNVIHVADGHLHVAAPGSRSSIAIYSPGHWQSAEVTSTTANGDEGTVRSV